jgi:hypothetical protein
MLAYYIFYLNIKSIKYFILLIFEICYYLNKYYHIFIHKYH